MSKAGAPRRRYIAIQLTQPANRAQLKEQLRLLGRNHDCAFQLTRFEWPHAIVRVPHEHAVPAREWLDADGLTPLSSSGTIKTLTDRLGVLQERT